MGRDHGLNIRLGYVSGDIGVDLGGKPGHVLPNNWETPMHLSLLPSSAPNILVCPPNSFDKSTGVSRILFY